MQTGPERGEERTSRAPQALRRILPANRNLRLTTGAIAELNSIVRSNPSLMQFTGQAAGHMLGGEFSKMNGSLAAEAGRPVSVLQLHGTVTFSGEDLRWLILMSGEQLDNHSFENTTRVTPLTGFVYDGKQYTCQACSFGTPSRVLFIEHVRCHSIQMPYSCGECGFRTTLKNIPFHYRHKHSCCSLVVHAKSTPLVEGIMQKLGPAAPYSVSKVDVQPDRQNSVTTCSTSTINSIPPDVPGQRSNLSLMDMVQDGDGLLQALINETNQQNLDMLAVNCDYRDGMYMCDLCKFSSRRPFEIFEHIIADVQRWKCCCTACVNSDPRSCSIVKATVAKLIRREQEVMGEAGDMPPTVPVTPIVIAPLGNHASSDQDQYDAAVSQPAVSDVPWQLPPIRNYSTANMHTRPPPSYSLATRPLVSTGRTLPFVSETVGSPTLYVQPISVTSGASSAHQQAATTTAHWSLSLNPQPIPTGSVSNKAPVRLRVVHVDSPSTSRENTTSTSLPTQRPNNIVSSSYQPKSLVRIAPAPTRPPQSSLSSVNSSAAPINSMPLPEWLHPTLQELTVNLSREANKKTQVESARETPVRNEVADSSCTSGQNQTGGTESQAAQGKQSKTRPGSGPPEVIELSDSSDSNEEERMEKHAGPNKTKETATSQDKSKSGDDRLGNIDRKKASQKRMVTARSPRAERKTTAEGKKRSNDSTPTGRSTDKGHFFRCGIPECGDSFSDPDGLKTHMKRCHGSFKLFPCPYCSCLWSDCGLLVKHITVHSGPNPYRCVQCDLCFETNTGLRNHFDDLHHVKEYFKCLVDDCGYESKLWTEFKIHVSCCHPAEDLYTCFACGGNFPHRTTYLRHVESGMETLICCAYCTMKSKLRYSIIRHLASVHDGLPIKVAVHTEVKCNQRNKSPLRTSSAEKQTTSTEKPAVKTQRDQRRPVLAKPAAAPVLCRCSQCDFADTDKALVDAHTKSHESLRDLELAFSCTVCTFGSNNMHEYMQHLANHRGQATQKLRYFRCTYCLFTSNQMALVEKHLDTKHSEEPFKFEVQQKNVTTNREVTDDSPAVTRDGSQERPKRKYRGVTSDCPAVPPDDSQERQKRKYRGVTGDSPAVPLDGSPERQKRKCAVVTQGGSNEGPQASRDKATPSKRPKRVSTPPAGHKRLVIMLERCDVPTLSTTNTRASRTMAKRKITPGDDNDDNKCMTKRQPKNTRTPRQAGVLGKTTGDQSESVQSSAAGCILQPIVASLTDMCGVGDEEPMFSDNEDVEEEDSYWREMIRKSISPDEKKAVQQETRQDDSSAGVSEAEDLDEAVTMSDGEDAYWRDVIQQKDNSAVVVKEEIILSDEEDDEDMYWRNIVKNSKNDKLLDESPETSQSATVRRGGRTRVGRKKSVVDTDDRVSTDASGALTPPRGDDLQPRPKTPGSSGGLTIAQYHCYLCKFECGNLRLFTEHVRSSHNDSIARTATDDGTVAQSDTAVSPDKMSYHCYLCSVDCQDWHAFELHMADVHSYTVIKTDKTSPFQDIVAVPIKNKHSPSRGKRNFTCSACSYTTNFKLQMKRHRATHINQTDCQPTSSSPKRTSLKKRYTAAKSTSDGNTSDTSRVAELTPTRKSVKIERRTRVKDTPVDVDDDDDDTDIGGADDTTDRTHQVRFVKHVHADGLYKCKKCSYTDGRIDRVESHVLRTHLYLMPYKCPYCHRDSSDYDTLLRHVADLHPKKPTCVIYRVTGAPKCRKLVRRYIEDMSTQNTQTVNHDVCGDNQSQHDSGVKKSSKTLPCRDSATSATLWKCTTCPDRVLPLKEMQRHVLKQHLSVEPYICAACPFYGDSSDTVDEHIRRAHSPDHHVTVLDMSVEKADSLRAMMARASDHQELTPDQCQCDGEFDHDQLRVVGKNGKLVYDCDLCDFQSSLKMGFVQHRKSHLLATAVRCGYCNYRAKNRHFLVNHITVAHPYCRVKYRMVDSNDTVTGVHLLSNGDTLTNGTDEGSTDIADVVGDKDQEPTQSDGQVSSALRDSGADVATPSDDTMDGNKSTGLPVEPLLTDCDYTVTINSTDSSIEEIMNGLTNEKSGGSTREKVDSSTKDKFSGSKEEKMDGLTIEVRDIAMEDKIDCSTEGKVDGSTVDRSTENNTNGSTKENLNVPTGKKTDGLTEEKTDSSKYNNTDGSAEKKMDCSTALMRGIATDEKTVGLMNEKADGSTEDKTEGSMKETTECLTEKKTEELIKEKTECSMEDKTEGLMKEKTACSTEEKTEGSIKENTNGSTEEKTDSSIDKKTDGSVKEKVDCSTEEKTEDAAEEKTDGLTEPKTDDSTEETTGSAKAEKTEGSVEEKTDGLMEEKTGSSIDKKTDGSLEEKVDGTTGEKTAVSAEEKTDGLLDEKTAGLTQEKTDTSTDKKTEGSVKEKVDGSTDKRTAEMAEAGVDAQQTFKCVTCSATMLLEQDIQHHVMVEHLEQKPYVCMHCDHSSADKRAVQLHTEEVHAGKPCSIIYETNGQLEATVKGSILSVPSDTASQPAKPRVCNLCKKYTTSSMFQFLDHIAKEIKYTPYQCPYCSHSSIWRNAVKTHIVADHPHAQIRILLSEDIAQNRKILELVKQSDSLHDSDEKSDLNLFGDKRD